MKNICINIILLFILFALPVLPGYLHLFNKISNPPLIVCTSNGNEIKMNILKGRFFNLESLLSEAFENKSNNNDKSPIHNPLDRISDLLIYTLPSKVNMFTPFFLLINKLFYFNNNTKKSIYLSPSTPPPEFICITYYK